MGLLKREDVFRNILCLGGTADAIALLEVLEGKLSEFPGVLLLLECIQSPFFVLAEFEFYVGLVRPIKACMCRDD